MPVSNIPTRKANAPSPSTRLALVYGFLALTCALSSQPVSAWASHAVPTASPSQHTPPAPTAWLHTKPALTVPQQTEVSSTENLRIYDEFTSLKQLFESTLSSEITRNRSIIATLQRDGKPPEQIAIVQKQLEGELLSELNSCGSTLRAREVFSRQAVYYGKQPTDRDLSALTENNIFLHRETAQNSTQNPAQYSVQNSTQTPAQNSAQNRLKLERGIVLFAPSIDLHIDARDASIFIPKGAAALIQCGDDICFVYDVHDTALTGAVQILHHGTRERLAPGLGARCDGRHLTRFTFSLDDATRSGILSRVMTDDADPRATKLASKIRKDIAALSIE